MSKPSCVELIEQYSELLPELSLVELCRSMQNLLLFILKIKSHDLRPEIKKSNRCRDCALFCTFCNCLVLSCIS